MRKIKNFKTFESFGVKSFNFNPNKEQLHFLNDNCNSWKFNYYTGRIDANSIEIKRGFKSIPEGIKFGTVRNYCDLSEVGITDAGVLPRTVGVGLGGSLFVKKNKMVSLKNCTTKVGGAFFCYDCDNLESLEGGPEEVGKDYIVNHCNLKNLIGAPKIINGDFICSYNPLNSFIGAPEIIKGEFLFNDIRIKKGKWGLNGWTEFLQEDENPTNQKDLILELITPEFLKKELLERESGTLMDLSRISDFPLINEFIKKNLTPSQKESYELIKNLDSLIGL